MCIFLPVYFSAQICSENYADNNKENREKKNVIYNLG